MANKFFGYVKGNKVSAAERLIEQDPKLANTPDTSNVWCMTPLILAAQLKSPDMAQMLIRHGATLDAKDRTERTALIHAAANMRLETITLLLSAGANATNADGSGRTLLMTACRERDAKKVLTLVKAILPYLTRKDLDAQDKDGETAMIHANRFGQAEAIRALLLAGADHTIKNREGRRPQSYGRTNDRTKGMQPTLNVLRWWEGELTRSFLVHKARALAALPDPSAAPLPAYLTGRGKKRPTKVPTLELTADGDAGEVLKYVVHSMPQELFSEFMRGFTPYNG